MENVQTLLVASPLPKCTPGERVFGSGEMADRIRGFAWENSSLGPIASWPAELVMAVNMLLSSNVIATLFWGPEQIMIYNDLYRPHLGAKHPALGQTLRTAWSEVYDLVEPVFVRPFQTGVATIAEQVSMQVLMDGQLVERIYTMDVNPIRGESPQGSVILGVYQIAIDYTESVQTARKLKASEARANRILESIGDAVIVTDENTNVQRMNAVAQGLTGWSEGEASNKPLAEIFRIVNETTRRTVESPADKVKRLGGIVGLANHTILIAKDGTEISIDDSAAPIRNDTGALIGIVLVFRDIKERRAAEVEREALAERLRQILAVTTDAVVTVDRDWTLSYLNPKAETLYGSQEGLVGRNLWEAFPAAVYEDSPFVEHYERAMMQGQSGHFETSYPDPLNITIALEVQPTRDGIVTFSQDVTERKRAEDEARRLLGERQRFYTLAESSPDFVGMCDLKGVPFYGNPAARALVGIDSAEEFNRTNLLYFFFPEDRDQILSEFLPFVLREGHGQLETRFMHQKTGEAIPMSYQIFLLEDGDGQPFGFGTVSRDLTVEKKTAAALLQNEKLAAVGRLAASIAHEINNPLESVTNLLYLARTSHALGEVQGYLDTAERELRRVSIISNQTLRFYKQSSSPTIISCGDLFGEVLSIYQGRLVNSHINVEKRKRATRPAECFEGEIRQVLNNLIGNAIDAMHPSGGRLLVRSREGTNWKTGRAGLVLTVADTGPGMPPLTLKKIFEAFYTTKGIGGTGLGLWVSKEIVDRHHGTLHVRSSQDEGHSGTVFTLFLPFDAVSRS